MTLSPYMPRLLGTSTSAALPPRVAASARGRAVAPPEKGGAIAAHAVYMYEYVRGCLCLGRLLDVHGAFYETQPCFVFLAREIVRALCDVDRMSTCLLQQVCDALRLRVV
jgi:hypothetical protein